MFFYIFRYKLNAQKLSNLMRDQIEMNPPLDRAVHAIEYVIRHRGAPNLRPAACRLSLFERESMDVVFLFTFFFLALVYMTVCITRLTSFKLFHFLRADKVKKNQ